MWGVHLIHNLGRECILSQSYGVEVKNDCQRFNTFEGKTNSILFNPAW